ncbi:MAG: TPM domain-containing protein [Burkholderiales bacterium]
MDVGRVMRHFVCGPWTLGRVLPAPVLRAIETAIARSEQSHGGEIRFAVETALDTRSLLRGTSARQRAIDVFSELRVWDTEHNNGVLIYLLLADHHVEIVADRGISQNVGSADWERVCRQIEDHLKQGRFERGLTAGIEAVGTLLARYYPRGNADKNELTDRPEVI